MDVNDNPPKFNRQFSATIREDREIGSFVLQVSTSDADIGSNANVTYQLDSLGTSGSKFAIDVHSGNITVKERLDRETMDKGYYILMVQATDGFHVNKGSVTLFIKDVNDNSPVFQQPLTFSFPEGSAVGYRIGTVTALDADKSSPNNQTYYSLKFPSDDISINANTGLLTSKASITYQLNQAARHLPNLREIIVIATDKGTPTMSAEAVVTINILDANDHAPVYQRDDYFSAVPVSIQHGQNIIQVVAEDKQDAGVNAEIEYFLAGGNGSSYFNVNRTSGRHLY